MNKRLYLYGFVFSESGQDFTCKGLDGQDVYFKSRGSLSLAISDFKMTDFSSLPREEFLQYLKQHHQAIENIMAEYCIIPFKFGTMIDNQDQIKKIFANSYDRIRKKFTLLQDITELDLMAGFKNFNQVFDEIRELPSIKQFKENVLSGPAPDFYEAQMKLGKMVNSVLDEKRNAFRKIIFNRLSYLSPDIITNDVTQDSMITSLAFLIQKKDHLVFEQTVEELDQYFEGKIDFRIVGPLPFYSFYTLVLQKGDFEGLDHARRTLNLPYKTGLPQINESYRKLSKACHPDNDSHDKNLIQKFEELHKAYQTVMEYMNDNNDSFLKEDVEQWIRVRPVERTSMVMA